MLVAKLYFDMHVCGRISKTQQFTNNRHKGDCSDNINSYRKKRNVLRCFLKYPRDTLAESSGVRVSESVFECEKKKNRNAQSPNAEGVRRGAVGAEDRVPKARRVSMQLGSLGERCKLN